MTLTQAIERAISALEKGVRAAEQERRMTIDPGYEQLLKSNARLDTEALAALREWKPEEKE